jgi:hypothetical protein
LGHWRWKRRLEAWEEEHLTEMIILPHFTDALIPIYNWGFRVLGGRYVSAGFGPGAGNTVECRLAKGEYTLYPSHLTQTGLTIEREESGGLAWRLDVIPRVAVKRGNST